MGNQRKQKRVVSSGGHSDGEGLRLSPALPSMERQGGWWWKGGEGCQLKKMQPPAPLVQESQPTSNTAGSCRGMNPFSRAKQTSEVSPHLNTLRFKCKELYGRLICRVSAMTKLQLIQIATWNAAVKRTVRRHCCGVSSKKETKQKPLPFQTWGSRPVVPASWQAEEGC